MNRLLLRFRVIAKTMQHFRGSGNELPKNAMLTECDFVIAGLMLCNNAIRRLYKSGSCGFAVLSA